MPTKAALKYLDTNGSPIKIAGKVLLIIGKQTKAYQIPYRTHLGSNPLFGSFVPIMDSISLCCKFS
jgi:hypothetical protein